MQPEMILTYAAIALGMGLIVATLLAFLLFLARDRSRSSYDQAHHRALLSEMRVSFEHKIAELTEKMMATEQRWREANHLIISAQQSQPDRPSTLQLSAFLKGMGLNEQDLRIDPTLVVMLTPFAPDEYDTFKTVADVCSRVGFRCERGDEQFIQGEILPHVVKLIVRARLIIANVSTRNPNVFFELGIAQAMDKQTILIAKTLKEMPFDLRTKRILIFRSRSHLEQELPEAILRAVAAVPNPSMT